MSLPPALAGTLADALGAPVERGARVSGGMLNEAWRVELGDGRRAFVKTSTDARPGGFQTEARGLRWLAGARGLPTPAVLAATDELLALEWVEPGRLDAAGEEALGRGLAATHGAGADGFGDDRPLVFGSLVLPGGPRAGWPELYAGCRLEPSARAAHDAGRLDAAAVADVERVCERLPELAGPPEPPARLHGDLWGGNVLASAAGLPYLIDPAAHGGHREVDLAMLRLFGGPSERCFAAYAEVSPLADGHEQRVELWQLFPLLVHAALFGGAYSDAAARAARRLAA